MASAVLLRKGMSEEAERLKRRTMAFALNVCGLLRQLPSAEPGPTVLRQLAKSATGVAFNYRASCRSRSHAEFTARIAVVAEEADETQGWLEFVLAAKLISSPTLQQLVGEATELTAIFSASLGTARMKQRKKRQ